MSFAGACQKHALSRKGTGVGKNGPSAQPLCRALGRGTTLLAAGVAAILDLIPNFRPLFAPSKRAVAYNAGFTGQVFFLYTTHNDYHQEASARKR